MKRSFLVALTVLSLGSSAFATSIRDVRLMYKDVPANGPIKNPTLTSVVVYGDGEAVRITCDAQSPRECDRRTVRKYTAYEIDAIDHLIEAARHGRIGRASSTARCIVAPSFTHHYSAANDSVLLMKGHLCTSILENKSPAAKRLIRLLDELRGVRH
jgi:hypothetical protein